MRMCARCRGLIAKASKAGQELSGKKGGRPRFPVTDMDVARVVSGELTADELGRKLGCSAVTVRRYLRQYRQTLIGRTADAKEEDGSDQQK